MSDSIVLSPFRYEKAYRYCENEKGSISRNEIQTLIKRNELTASHIDIIKMLYEYRYLTSHHIESSFGGPSLPDITGLRICSIKEAVSFMVKTGIMLRHYFSWQEQLNNVLTDRRSINFYTLSKGTCIFLQKELGYAFDVDSYMTFDKDYAIFQRLALNSYVTKYRNNDHCRHNSFVLFKKASSPVYDTVFEIDCDITTRIEDKDIRFILLPVRRNEGASTELDLKLKLIKDHLLFLLAKKQLDTTPGIILLCEDDMHIVETYMALSKLKNGFQYLFTTDVRQYNDHTFDKLLVVSSDSKGVKYKEYSSPLVR